MTFENEYLEKLYRDGVATALVCLQCGEMMVRTRESHPTNPPQHIYLCKNEHDIRLTDKGFDAAMKNQDLRETLQGTTHEAHEPVSRDGVRRGGEVRTTSSTGGQKGVKEARFDLIPAGPLKEVAILYGRGALKYEDHNWRKGYEWEKSGASIDRHHNAWRMGYDYDVCSNEPEMCLHELDGVPWTDVSKTPDTCYNHTGCHHMTAIIFHAMAILEFKDRHPDFDNRYKPHGLMGKMARQIALPTSYDVGTELYEQARKAFQKYDVDSSTVI